MKDIMSAMRAGEVVLGPFSVTGSATMVETIGYSGADFVIIDCEHAATSAWGQELEGLVRAAYAADVTPLVRTTSKEVGQLLKAGNFGAKGIIVPHINDPEEMQRMVQGIKLPPLGNRSCAPPVRAAKHAWEPWPQFVARSNEEVMVIPLFEEPRGLDNIEAILDVPGIDIAFFGPYDLAQRLGGVGTPEAEAMVDKYLDKTLEACNKRGIPVMNLAWGVDQAAHQVEKGCRAIAYSTDLSLFNIVMREQYGAVRERTQLALPRLAPAGDSA